MLSHYFDGEPPCSKLRSKKCWPASSITRTIPRFRRISSRQGRNVWIGGGALILPGGTIGDDAIIGAGSVVTRDVPRGATALGHPARLRGEDLPTDRGGDGML